MWAGRICSLMTVSSVSSDAKVDRSRSIPCGDGQADDVLTALSDQDCQCILTATASEPKTASELVDTCGIPQSTLYRKLELLVDTDLLEERVRLHDGGKHPSEYVRSVEDVVIGVGECSVSVDQRVAVDD